MVWPGKGEACRKVGVTTKPCTDFARIDVSDAQVGTKKQALRSNQETDEGKLRRPGELLDKENPIQGTPTVSPVSACDGDGNGCRGGDPDAPPGFQAEW